MRCWLGVLYFVLLLNFANGTQENFREELLVRPLPDGNVFSHLQFTSTIRFNPSNASHLSHFNLFPKPIAQTIQKFGTEQLQLTFTQGRWHENHWGTPLIDAPTGVQLIASFLPSRNALVEWKSLIHSLAGMFCTSLNSLDETKTVDPQYTFSDFLRQNNKLNQEKARQEQIEWQQELLNDLESKMAERGEVVGGEWKKLNDMSAGTKNFAINRERIANQRTEEIPSSLFYGEMPEEAVCTENLTPWTKLLPCRSESGLGKLLHPLVLYNALYHSMGVTVRYILPDHCNSVEECDEVTLELVQNLGVVFKTEEHDNYEIAKLYGEKYLSSCILSGGNSFVYVQAPEEMNISPPSQSKQDGLHFYDLQSPLSLKISNNEISRQQIVATLFSSPIQVARSALGSGDENGGILMQIKNPTAEELPVVYMEYLPWYFPIYFHSLRVFFNGQQVGLADVASKWRFTPGEDHSSPSIIEIEFVIPARTSVVFTYRHDQAFLQWTEHPPDAHRGSDIPSACVTVKYDKKPKEFRFTGLDWSPISRNLTTKEEKAFEFRLYTEGLLVLLPTPDFSMPYNVITLTCTMFAIVFTTTINVLTRRFSYLTEGGEYSSGRLSMFLYRKVRDFLTK